MSYSLLAGLLWLIVANLIAMFPSKDYHWRNAYVLITVGIPILGWITWGHGPILGLIFLFGGASVLRWPVWYLWKWLRESVRKASEWH